MIVIPLVDYETNERATLQWSGNPDDLPTVTGLEHERAAAVLELLAEPVPYRQMRSLNFDDSEVVYADPLESADAFLLAVHRLPGQLLILPEWNTATGLPVYEAAS